MFAHMFTPPLAADDGTLAPAPLVSHSHAPSARRVTLPAAIACPVCTPWAAPLAFPERVTSDGALVRCTFEQWLAWAWHVRTHRRLHTAARDFTESDS